MASRRCGMPDEGDVVSPTPRASVVIAVRNGASAIGDCVDSVLATEAGDLAFEVIVVDNASTDGTRAILEGYRGAIRLLHEETRGAAATRNRGIREARAELIAITDADCIVDRHWLPRLVEPLSDPSVGVVGGAMLSRRPCNRIEAFGERIHDQRAAIEHFEPPYVISANWASRRAVLLEVGLFDESLLRGQDVDLAWRIHRAGYRLVYQDGAPIYHLNERTLPGLVHEGFTHGYHGVRVLGKHRTGGESRGMRGGTRIGRRLARDLRAIFVDRDHVAASLQLLFDLGKSSGELFALSRGIGRARP